MYRDRIYNFVSGALKLVGIILFLYLSLCAFTYTEYMDPLRGGAEFPIVIEDSKIRNAAVILFAFFLIAMLKFAEDKLQKKALRIIEIICVSTMAAWLIVTGILWVTAYERELGADPLYMVYTAEDMLKNDYSMFEKGNYMDMYPMQLGFSVFLSLLMRLFGTENYIAFEAVQVCMVAGSAVFLYGILKLLGKGFADKIFFCILMSICFPFLFYSSWLYGEVGGLFFSVAGLFLSLLGYKKNIMIIMCSGIILFTIAVLLRMNSWVIIIAYTGIMFFECLKNKRYGVLLPVVLTIILPILSTSFSQKYFEDKGGYEHSEGLSVYSWISLGLQENNGRYGWYYPYTTNVYEENDYDTEMAMEVYKHDIGERLSYFRDNPSYSYNFFRGKLRSQWNAPLYQSMYFNYGYNMENIKEGTMAYRLATDSFPFMLSLADRLQMVVYLGGLLYCIFGIKRKYELWKYIPVLTVFGGFLLSIIWEAKTRYILPYYVILFPVAAAGFYEALLWIEKKWWSK